MGLQFNSKKSISICLVVILITSAFAFSFPQIAIAGYKGQQISFVANFGAKFTYLKVSGKNQNNKKVAWEKKFSSPGVQSWIIAGWWWKDQVKIEFDVPGKGRLTCTSSIPTDQGKLNYYLVQYLGLGSGCTTQSEIKSFDQDVSRVLRTYILAKTKTQPDEGYIHLIDKKIGKFVLSQLIEPACFLPIAAALPYNTSTIYLEPEIIKLCDNELKAIDFLLSLFKVPLPLRKSSSSW